MPTAETEAVERYVGLHQHIERLRSDKRPPLPPELNADEARAYQMAALFRAATPGAAMPNPAFVAALRDRLIAPSADEDNGSAVTAAPTAPPPPPRRLGRRGLLRGGLAATAAAAAGVAAGVALDRGRANNPPTTADLPLVPQGSGIWVAVAQADMIPLGGVMRFATDYIVGFLRHTPEGFTALSGVCTHMSCFLLWNAASRTYDCPCHGGRFNETGQSASTSPIWYRPLPAIQTKVEQGQVWVYVVPPARATNTTDTSPDGAIYGAPDPVRR